MTSETEPSYDGEFDCADCEKPCAILEWQMIGLKQHDPVPPCGCCSACDVRREDKIDAQDFVLEYGLFT